jgi:hypothetical protein
MRRLSGEELSTLLRNVWVEAVLPPNVRAVPRHQEGFGSDGSWVMGAEGGEIRGRFRIENNQVCVTGLLQSGEICRDIAQSRDGDYWVIGDPGSPKLPRRVAITPME